ARRPRRSSRQWGQFPYLRRGMHTAVSGVRLWPMMRRVPPIVVDGGLGLALLIAMLVERVSVGADSPAGVALSGAIALGLALRRRAALAGCLIGSVAQSLEALFVAPSTVSPYANLIGIYSLGLYGAGARVWWGPAIVPFGVFAYFSSHEASSLGSPVGVLF